MKPSLPHLKKLVACCDSADAAADLRAHVLAHADAYAPLLGAPSSAALSAAVEEAQAEELAARGVVGFKAFMSASGIGDFPLADDYTLHAGMGRAAALGLPVAVHAENEALTAGLREAGIPPSIRAEALPLDDAARLFLALSGKS